MKENKYNDENFFQKYSAMSRSIEGLKGAGEWSELQKILPGFQEKGVSDVIGIDLSEKMLQTAQEKNTDEKISYRCMAMEEAHFPAATFDVVISSLAFHYIQDFESIVRRIGTWLKPQGVFVFSVEHPVFTSQGTQDWWYDEKGEILHFPVDNYYYEGPRQANFLGEQVTKYHRTLTTYLNTLLQHGFEFQHIIEPQPPKEMRTIAGMQDEMRRPMMLLVSVRKK